jgi:hypothetical protein
MHKSLASDPVTDMESPASSDVEMDDRKKVKGVRNIIVMDCLSNT